MKYFSCKLSIDEAFPFARTVTRLRPAGRDDGLQAGQQILAFGNRSFREVLFEAEGHGAVQFGPEIQLKEQDGSGASGEVRDAVWDAFSSTVIVLRSTSVLQLTNDNTLHLLAGHSYEEGSADGSGHAARFRRALAVVSDGAGSLYIADENRIRKVQLPGSLHGRWPSLEGGAAGASAAEQVTVSTMPFQAHRLICSLTYVPSATNSASSSSGCCSGSLVFATGTALFRVAMGGEGSSEPELWAGAIGAAGQQDGVERQARFRSIWEIVADSKGCIYVAGGNGYHTHIRKVTPSGEVSTLLVVEDLGTVPSISLLANGTMAMTVTTIERRDLLLVDLKLPPPALTASAIIAAPPAPAGPPPRTLSSDLAALLDRQPDGTADVTLMVGDRSFPAHRGILAARSDYFRQRLEGGFADGSSTQLSLPEAEPEAFAVVLRYIYTGAAEIPSTVTASVATLADRLLLPELCQAAQSRVLAEVRPETVVERLLWAEAAGPSFKELLSGLKEWCLEHREDVVETAPESVEKLMGVRSAMAMELFVSRKRPRRQ